MRISSKYFFAMIDRSMMKKGKKVMRPRSRILAVDDNIANIKVLTEILAEDYMLETAFNGEEALSKARVFRPDIILLDIMMPGISGYDVCRHIREDQRLRHVKVIMVSAKAMISERVKGYEVGADDYLTKPFSEEELMAKVRVFLRLKAVEEVDQLKTDVLSLLSHETRTPLNGIIGPAEMLMGDEVMGIPERKSWAEMIFQSGNQLQEYFEKVMILSSLKSGKIIFHSEPSDLGELIREVKEKLVGRRKEKKVTVHLEITEGISRPLDRKLMTNAIMTLVDNAIRFSPNEGEVAVVLAQKEDHILLEVRDQGPGIDSDVIPFIFNDFIDSDIRHHTEGHGLNLAIAHWIIQDHGGDIQVESSKGKGSIFSILLPRVASEDKENADDTVGSLQNVNKE
jgi:two-component system, sensor histidine kinase and response regulator